MTLTDLGRRMKVYRAQHDLTQAEFGQKIGAGHAHVSRMESGVVTPTQAQAKKMVRLGVIAFGDYQTLGGQR